VPYGHWETLPGNVQIRMQQAGHVLGSAYIEVEHGSERFVFSGDLGSRETPLLKDPVSPERADVLVLESTYGDRNHEGRESRVKALEDVLCRSIQNHGVTIIPAFSLGRTQELLYEMNRILENIQHKNCCPMLGKIDILIDSPLANRLTEIYNDMKEYWDEEAHEILKIDDQPLVFKNLVEIDRPGEHRDTIDYLKKSGVAAVVIAGSGMCTGGRVVNYLKTFIGKETTDIVFIGFQAAGTPGRYIQEKETSEWVRLDGRPYTIKAAVHTLTGYSAHADQADLIKFVKGIPVKPREIRLVHGEEKAKAALKAKLEALGYVVT
jgi:metallo-beta-lactamase family protein